MSKYDKFKAFLLFLFVLDTGNWFYGKFIALAFFVLVGTAHMSLRGELLRPPAKPFYVWVSLLLLLVPSLVEAFSVGVEFSEILAFTAPILLFPLLVAVAVWARLDLDHFIEAGKYFALFVIVLFAGRLIALPLVESLVANLGEQSAAGYFSYRQSWLGQYLPGVYFKATLILVPVGVLAYFRGQHLTVFFAVAAMVVAPTRAGVVFLLLVLLFFGLKRVGGVAKYAVFATGAFSLVIVAGTQQDFLYGLEMGYEVRFLHLQSILIAFEQEPDKLLFGFGPGTEFFSYGVSEFVRNSEVSHLEVLRRYGAIASILLFLGFFYYATKLMQWKYYGEAVALISFFLVSASNPVLLMTPAILLYALIAKCVLEGKASSFQNGILTARVMPSPYR